MKQTSSITPKTGKTDVGSLAEKGLSPVHRRICGQKGTRLSIFRNYSPQLWYLLSVNSPLRGGVIRTWPISADRGCMKVCVPYGLMT